MSRLAWFHCFNGIAGDMALGALLDAGADLDTVRRAVGSLRIDGWSVDPRPTQRCGIRATAAGVHAPDDHHHRPYAEIRSLLNDAELPARVAGRAGAVFQALAEVEGAIHGVAPDDVEFHEVGARDAIVDVVGTCAALESLRVDVVHASSLAVGTGTFPAAHGVLPNPGPAVVGLLARRGAPAHGVPVEAELTTPTGAAIVTALASGFGPLPPGRVVAVGYGAGSRELAGRPNVVQVVIVDTGRDTPLDTPLDAGRDAGRDAPRDAGRDGAERGEDGRTAPGPGQPVVVIEANVDDATGEVLAHAVGLLLAAGAHDAWITPIVMKKGRPAATVHALADPVLIERLAGIMVRETGTLGIRAMAGQRWPQRRHEETVEVSGHPIRVKRTARRVKVEYEDAAAAARALGQPLREILLAAEAAGSDAASELAEAFDTDPA